MRYYAGLTRKEMCIRDRIYLEHTFIDVQSDFYRKPIIPIIIISIPVSYTHLDVYKRQVMPRVVAMAVRKEIAICKIVFQLLAFIMLIF